MIDHKSSPPPLSRVTGDLLRLGAMIAVLIIHATGRGENAFRENQDLLSQDFLAVSINQLARFSVPLFVLISGYGLGRKYRQTWTPGEQGSFFSQIAEFFRNRFLKIGVPFVVWTLALLVLTGRLNLTAFENASDFLQKIVWDNLVTIAPYFYRRGVDYHFYFFIIILQMYALFPILFRLVRAASPRTRTVILVLLFAWQLLWTYPSVEIFRAFDWPRPSFPTAFFIYWVFYFYAGIYFAFRDRASENQAEGASAFAPAVFAWTGAALAFALMLGEYLYRSQSEPVPGYYNHFSRWSVVLYSLFVFAIFLAGDGRISAYFAARPAWARRLQHASALTFSVYIFHTWILRGIEATPAAQVLVVTIVLLTAVSFGVAYALDRWVRPAFLRTVLGLP